MKAIESKNTVTAKDTAKGPFAGCTIIVTGTLTNCSRNTINAKIESLGAKAGSTVSSKTDYLIAGDNAGSKLDKARKLGITVLSEQEFLRMVESVGLMLITPGILHLAVFMPGCFIYGGYICIDNLEKSPLALCPAY